MKRAICCEDEYGLAFGSWDPIFAELWQAGSDKTVSYTGECTALAENIAAMVNALNNVLSLPATLEVIVEPCGEPNGFYDLDLKQIAICSGLAGHIRDTADS